MVASSMTFSRRSPLECDLFENDVPVGFAGGDENLRRYVNNSPTNAVDPSGTVIVFVDGIRSDKDSNYADLLYHGLKSVWDKAKGKYSDQGFIYFNLWKKGVVEAVTEENKYNEDSATGLAALLIELSAKNKCDEPIFLVGYSNGATIIDEALKKIDKRHKEITVIFMGAALNDHHDLTGAAGKVGKIIALKSKGLTGNDFTGGRGAGGVGFLGDANKKIIDSGNLVEYSADEFSHVSTSRENAEATKTPTSGLLGWVSVLGGELLAKYASIGKGTKTCFPSGQSVQPPEKR